MWSLEPASWCDSETDSCVAWSLGPLFFVEPEAVVTRAHA